MELNDVKDGVPQDGAVNATADGTVDGTVDVLIVGAGPCGLALACDLARRGVRHLLVERSGTLFAGSRGRASSPAPGRSWTTSEWAGRYGPTAGPHPWG